MRWTVAIHASARQRFANDLRDGRTLIAVFASSNRSKSHRDPAEWMPALGKCRYVKHWVAVKIRWRMKVNGAERRALRQPRSRREGNRWRDADPDKPPGRIRPVRFPSRGG